MNDSDRHDLLSFIESVVSRLQTMLTELSHVDGAAGDLARDRLLQSAWGAVQAHSEMETLIRRVESEQFDAALDAAGLSGAELAFKLERVQRAWDAVREHVTTSVPHLWRKWLQRVDVILKSLLSVLGAGEALAEFKEELELDLDTLTDG